MTPVKVMNHRLRTTVLKCFFFPSLVSLLVTFAVAIVKISDQSDLKKKFLFTSQAEIQSPSQWGRLGGRSWKCPQSGNKNNKNQTKQRTITTTKTGCKARLQSSWPTPVTLSPVSLHLLKAPKYSQTMPIAGAQMINTWTCGVHWAPKPAQAANTYLHLRHH